MNRKILNFESRINILNDIVVDGEDAKAVLKYVQKVKEEADKKMLELLRGHGDVERHRSDYRALCHLVDTLTHAAEMGDRKDKTLAQLYSKPQK